jgi:WD40 repeat protein
MRSCAARGARVFVYLLGMTAPAYGQDKPPSASATLPAGAVKRLGTNLFRPGHDVRSIAASADGKHLVTAGFNTIAILDAGTGAIVRRFGYRYPVQATFTLDGKALLVAASGDYETRRIDLETEKEFNILVPKGLTIRVSAFSADRKQLAFVGPPDNRLHIWDIETKKPLRSFPAPGDVWHLAWSRDGNAIGMTVKDKLADVADKFLIWDAVTGKELVRLIDESPGWRVFAFSPTEDLVALCRRWGDILLIDSRTGKTRHALTGHKTFLADVAFTSDGKRLASSSADGQIGLWDVAAGKSLGLAKGHYQTYPRLVFSPDGKRLFSGGDDVIRVWDGVHLKALDDESLPRLGVERIAFVPGGKSLVAIDRTTATRWWDLKTGDSETKKIKLPTASLQSSFVFSADGRRVLWAAGGRARLTDVVAEKEVLEFGTKRTFTGRWLWGCGWGQDEKTVIAAGEDYAVYVFDAGADKVRREIKGVSGPMYSVSVSPDGNLVACSEGSGGLVLLDVDKGAVRWRNKIEFWSHAASFTTFSPDGRWLAFHGMNRHGVFDTATGKIARGFSKDRRGDRFSFSPDSRMIAVNDISRSATSQVEVWEVATGALRLRLAGHQGTVHDVAFSPHGGFLASSGADTTILFWDMTGKARFGPGKELSDKQLEQSWQALSGDDGVKAFEAIQRLALSGQAPRFFKDRLEPITDKYVLRLIAGLGDDLEEVRARAAADLVQLGVAAETALRAALKKEFPSAEAAKEIPTILKQLERASALYPKGERLRYLRAIETLERDGSEEARRILSQLAGGHPGAEVSDEARRALQRLKRTR